MHSTIQFIPEAARAMPSTRMIPPRPNQVRRKALSFLLFSLALALSSWSTKAAGFSTGDRLIIDALSFLLFCFLLLVALALKFGLLEGDDDEEEPNPRPGELVFFGGVDSEVFSLRLVLGFWVSEGF